ncbi:unnamed protein product [Pylaiella littoralis]
MPLDTHVSWWQCSLAPVFVVAILSCARVCGGNALPLAPAFVVAILPGNRLCGGNAPLHTCLWWQRFLSPVFAVPSPLCTHVYGDRICENVSKTVEHCFGQT